MRIPLLTCIPALLLVQPAGALTYKQFVQCVSASGRGTVCQLDAGTYPVSATIWVGRSNLIITGTVVNSPQNTTLRRAAGFEGSLLGDVYVPGKTLNSVTIQNLTFDGNRAENKLNWSVYSPDVSIFAITNLSFLNCEFKNAPSIDLGFNAGGTAGVVVNHCSFTNPVIYGLWSDALGDNNNTYQECAQKRFVKNILVANSQFLDAGEPAILGEIINVQIVNNTFTNNHSYSIPFDDDGGQIDLEVCTNNALIWRNTFQNGAASPNGHTAGGIELHGTNISIIDNVVKNNSGGGIGLDGVQNAYIANIDPTTGTFGNAGSGIGISHSSSTFRLTEGITIDHADSSGNGQWGIWSDTSNTTPAEPVNHLTIVNTCLNRNTLGPTYLINLGPDVTNQNNITSGCGPE